jgi:hypothetical protein
MSDKFIKKLFNSWLGGTYVANTSRCYIQFQERYVLQKENMVVCD